MNITQLREARSHHGTLRLLGAAGYELAQRILDFELLVVAGTASVESCAGQCGREYETRQVGGDEYARGTRWLGPGHERSWAFERGDRCFANFFENRIVGYVFYADHPTVVRPGLYFTFPDDMTYAYASWTHGLHRGLRLASARTSARRAADRAAGRARTVVWYVALNNLASHAAMRRAGGRTFGLVGYVRTGERTFRCFADERCRELGLGLAPAGPGADNDIISR